MSVEALMEVSGLKSMDVNTGKLPLVLPRLNAAGRIDDPMEDSDS